MFTDCARTFFRVGPNVSLQQIKQGQREQIDKVNGDKLMDALRSVVVTLIDLAEQMNDGYGRQASHEDEHIPR